MLILSMVLLAAATPAVAPVADPADTVVCKRDRLTGSRFDKKICMTRRAWDALAERDGRALQETRSRTTTYTPEH